MTFGPFRLDPVSGQLYRDSAVVPLAPKAFAVLQHLAAQPGRLFTKEELLESVWPGVFVGDAVLKVDDPRYPQGARRRCPVADVHRDRPPARLPLLAPTTPIADEPAPRRRRRSVPRVHYARSGNVNIAYQVIGTGPLDLVFVMGWVSHLEYFWNEPSFARFLDAAAVDGAADPVRQARHRPCRTPCRSTNSRRSSSAWTTSAR